jgi:hypothetical protein
VMLIERQRLKEAAARAAGATDVAASMNP